MLLPKFGLLAGVMAMGLVAPRAVLALSHTDANYPLRVKFVQTYMHSNHPAWGDGPGTPAWRVVDGLIDLKDGVQISGASYSMVCGDDAIPMQPKASLVFSARWVKPGRELEVVMDPYLGDKGWHGPWKNTTCRMKLKPSLTPNHAALRAAAAWVSPPPPVKPPHSTGIVRRPCAFGDNATASNVTPVAGEQPLPPCTVRP